MLKFLHVSTVHVKEFSHVFLQGGAGSSALAEQVTKNMCQNTGMLNQSMNACPHINNK